MLKKILAVLVMLYAALAMAAVDVNKATDAELDGIKGIGPAITKLIVTERKKGEFKSWQDFIDRVKGVGEKSAVKLSENGLTVNGQAFKGAAMKDDKKESRAAVKEEKKDAKATTTTAVEKKETRAEMKAEKKAEK
nr:helix-hairpin-helix domain-containing protein [Pseudomonadota bacterium]